MVVYHYMEAGTRVQGFSSSTWGNAQECNQKEEEIIVLLSRKKSTVEVGKMILSMTFRTVDTLIGIGLGEFRGYTHVMMDFMQSYKKVFLY